MARLASLQIGPAQQFGPNAVAKRTWASAIDKRPVDRPVLLTVLGLEGDEQADRRVHGGPDKALCAYPGEHYAEWLQAFPTHAWGPGGFGENLTLAELVETEACLGDRWALGEAILEISQPRQPCVTLARRWELPELPKRVVQTGRTGWYFRVCREGLVAAGQMLTLLERPFPQWTVARANEVLYRPERRSERSELASLPPLAASWREELA
jgi:MOSC domain-containing protein YiiM